MSGRRSLLSNLIYSAFSWLSTIGLLIVNILAARILGTENYGRFAFCYALVALFEVLTDVGMREYILRGIARANEHTKRYLGEALVLKTILCLITIAAIVLTTWILDLPRELTATIAILSVAMVAKSYKLLLRATLIAHERFRREAFISILDRTLVVVACTTALWIDGGLIAFVSAFAGAGVVNLAITAVARGDLRGARMPRSRARIIALLRGSLPFGLTAAASLAYFRLDSVMITLMRGEVENGWYNAAYRLTEGLIIIPSVIQYAIFPRLSVLHHESPAVAEPLGQRAVKYLAAISVFVAACGIVLARPAIQFIYGARYGPSAESLQILLVGLPFMFLWCIFMAILNATDRAKIPFIGITIGTILNVGLNLVLIPEFGHQGASVATVLAEVFLFAFLLSRLRRGGFRLEVTQPFLRALAGAALAIPIMLWLESIHMVLAGVVGAAIYVGCLYAVGFLDATDRDALGRVANRLRWRSSS